MFTAARFPLTTTWLSNATKVAHRFVGYKRNWNPYPPRATHNAFLVTPLVPQLVTAPITIGLRDIVTTAVKNDVKNRKNVCRDAKSFHLSDDFSLSFSLKNNYDLSTNMMCDDPQSEFYWNEIVSNTKWENFQLSNVAKKVLSSPNAGGNSIVSETMSAEILHRLYGANDIRTEMEVEYIFDNWKIADYCIRISGKNVGVSVTRAMGFPYESSFDLQQADKLLRKKINGLVLARNGISERDSFYTAILHVFCQSNRIKNVLYRAFKTLEPDLRDNIILIATVAENADYLFFEDNKKKLKVVKKC
jgi:hypothetical protein